MKVTALIMAGGKGERFWPQSRENCPKQFIDILGCGKTMIQLTVERILPLISIEDIYIVTNARYKGLVKEQITQIPDKNIICEPVGKNTAPCIGLGATYILGRNEDAVMVVLAADHMIKDAIAFRNTLVSAIELTKENNNLVTIGILPDSPETGYGYIKKSNDIRTGDAYAVESFVEKPDKDTAIKYLQSKAYFWNSGIFIWKATTIMNAMKEYMPDTYEDLQIIKSAIGDEQEEKVLNDVFCQMKAESIDYGVMEKAKNVYVIPGEFGWDDVGSWLAVERLGVTDEAGNAVSGNVVSINTNNTIIKAGNKLVAVVGLEDIVIVDTPDVTLVGNKNRMADIKKLLQELGQDKERQQYL